MDCQKVEDVLEFFSFPFQLYKGCKYWVPPVINSLEFQLDRKLSPFKDQFEWELFRVVDGSGGVLSQTIGIWNSAEPDIIRWGWWESRNQVKANQLLFENVAEWGRDKGAKKMIGPLGFTQFDPTALLIEGFDHLPTIAETYHKPYYKDILRQIGMETFNEYVSFKIDVPQKVPTRIQKMAELLLNRYRWDIRIARGQGTLRQYAGDAFRLMEDSHSQLDGYFPKDQNIQKYYFDQFLPLIKKEYTVFIYKNGEIRGFGIALPNYSRVFQQINGSLGWLGPLRVLIRKRWHSKADLLLIGVHPEDQNKGMTACIFEKMIRAMIRNGVQSVNSNPELRSNQKVQNLWKAYSPSLTQVRRTYAYEL